MNVILHVGSNNVIRFDDMGKEAYLFKLRYTSYIKNDHINNLIFKKHVKYYRKFFEYISVYPISFSNVIFKCKEKYIYDLIFLAPTPDNI